MSDVYDNDDNDDYWQDYEADCDRHENEQRLEWEEQENWQRTFACQCGGDMPGICPGPQNCPMCRDKKVEDIDEDDQD